MIVCDQYTKLIWALPYTSLAFSDRRVHEWLETLRAGLTGAFGFDAIEPNRL